MADIKINKPHSMETDDIRKRLDEMAGELQSQYGIKSAWSGNTATLSGTGVKKGMVELTQSTVNVEITLGLLAKAVKGKIEKQINIALNKVLA